MHLDFPAISMTHATKCGLFINELGFSRCSRRSNARRAFHTARLFGKDLWRNVNVVFLQNVWWISHTYVENPPYAKPDATVLDLSHGNLKQLKHAANFSELIKSVQDLCL